MLEKTCSRCKQLLDVSKFYKDKDHADGYRSACKVCESPRLKEYRIKNKESYTEYKKQYDLENKKALLEQKKEYHLKNRQIILEHKKEYYLKNREILKKKRLLNKERIKEYDKKYRSNNPEKSQANCSLRRTRKAGNSGRHTGAEIKYLKEIQNYQCLMCLKFEPEIKLTLDHILPISKGGGDGIGNCQMLCKSCNSSKNAKFIDLRGIKPSKKPQHF